MALSASTVWEVRTTGSDNSGGGFVTGSGGTDYSQQDAAQFSGTDLMVDATTNTKVTSAAHSFTSADVGNLIQITAGTGFTTGFYQVASVASGAATLDRSPAAVGTSGGTWALGGALASPGKAVGALVQGNRVYIKAGSGYTVSANISISATGGLAFSGYGTTRNDGNKATITAAAGCTSIFAISNFGIQLMNLYLDAANIASYCINHTSGGEFTVLNCVATRFANTGIAFTSNAGLILNTEVTAGKTGCSYGINSSATGGRVVNCNVHDNPCPGILFSNNNLLKNCLIINNTGASSDGINYGYSGVIENCTVYGNGRDGIRMTDSLRYISASEWRGNIFVSNGGYGINASGGSTNYPGLISINDYNSFYSNTSGAMNNISAGAHDVTLTANPFTNAAGGNFSLNNTAGGGAALRAAGIPGTFPGGTTTGYLDIGAVQHQDSGGGGTTVVYTNAGGLGRL